MSKQYYVSAQELYEELMKCRKNKKHSNEITILLFKMAENITRKSCFRGYTKADKDDMKSEAVITCLNAIFKFNIKKSNPFSYFTRVIMNSYKYYLKRKYKVDNFKMDLYEDTYIQANKPFVNEYKKDTEDYEKNSDRRLLDD